MTPRSPAFAGLPEELPEALASGLDGIALAPALRAAADLGEAAAERLGGRTLRIRAERVVAGGPMPSGTALVVHAQPAAAAGPGPSLHVRLDAAGLHAGVTATAGDPEATARVRRALLGTSDASLRETCVRLLSAGWRPRGVPLPDADDGSLPEALRPWLVRRGLHAERDLPWAGRLLEPALAEEIADLWREVLPLLDAMGAPDTAPAARAGPPRTGGA